MGYFLTISALISLIYFLCPANYCTHVLYTGMTHLKQSSKLPLFILNKILHPSVYNNIVKSVEMCTKHLLEGIKVSWEEGWALSLKIDGIKTQFII